MSQKSGREECKKGSAAVLRRVSPSPETRSRGKSSRRDGKRRDSEDYDPRRQSHSDCDRQRERDRDNRMTETGDYRRRRDGSRKDSNRDLDRRVRDRDVDQRHNRVRNYDDGERRRSGDSKRGGHARRCKLSYHHAFCSD